MNLDLSTIETPCYLCDEQRFLDNVAVLERVRAATDCRILLALKAFAMPEFFSQLRPVLCGVCASSPHEARLGREQFGGEVHVYAPAYGPTDMAKLLPLANHISFNSFAQYRRYRAEVEAAGTGVKCGLRVNPGYSEVETLLYDPCAPGSRLGVTSEAFVGEDLDGLTGLHVHALCEQNADVLERVLEAFEGGFGHALERMEWVNFGGGHLVTREDYDVDLLIKLVDGFQRRYGVRVYLEPGEAVAWQAGVLVTTVLDIVDNGMPVVILDTSATAHMPDVLEMPYRPEVVGAGKPGVLPHTYRLGGLTCLAGDVMGDYSFAEPLRIGSKLVFTDMAHYTMVKNTTFNGIQLPALAVRRAESGEVEVVRRFGYEDYLSRLR